MERQRDNLHERLGYAAVFVSCIGNEGRFVIPTMITKIIQLSDDDNRVPILEFGVIETL